VFELVESGVFRIQQTAVPLEEVVVDHLGQGHGRVSLGRMPSGFATVRPVASLVIRDFSQVFARWPVLGALVRHAHHINFFGDV
jgi:hypothetical protein